MQNYLNSDEMTAIFFIFCHFGKLFSCLNKVHGPFEKLFSGTISTIWLFTKEKMKKFMIGTPF